MLYILTFLFIAILMASVHVMLVKCLNSHGTLDEWVILLMSAGVTPQLESSCVCLKNLMKWKLTGKPGAVTVHRCVYHLVHMNFSW